MMRRCFVIILVALVGCSASHDVIIDEEALGKLPSFEYAGYVYYVHPNLTERDRGTYRDFYKEVKSLDSYGYRTWFIPTIPELEAAARQRALPVSDNYFSCSKQGKYYLYLKVDVSYDKIRYDVGTYKYASATVAPMIKFRK